MCEILWRGSPENQVLLQQRELLRTIFTGNLILLNDGCTLDCALQQYHELPFLKSVHLNYSALLLWQWGRKKRLLPGKWTNCWKGLIPCESKVHSLLFSRFGFPSSWLRMNHQESIKETPQRTVFISASLCKQVHSSKERSYWKGLWNFISLLKHISDLTCHVWLVTCFVTFKQSNQLYHPRCKLLILYIYHVFYKLYLKINYKGRN